MGGDEAAARGVKAPPVMNTIRARRWGARTRSSSARSMPVIPLIMRSQ